MNTTMTVGTDEQTVREQIVETARAMNRSGLNQGTSGNLSVRFGDGLLITPSGIAYDDLSPDQIVPMDFDGKYQGNCRPSSEWRFHCDILRERPDAGAVLHSHSLYSTILACQRRSIPAFHYMIAVAGGTDIRCADYATYGTQALSDEALKALDGRKACLLANHGLIAIGKNLKTALSLAVEVETLAKQYCHMAPNVAPVLLDDAEMAVIIEGFKTYGTQPDLASKK